MLKLLSILLLAQFSVPSHSGALAVAPSGGGKTQLFTDSFAYTSSTDLVADAPTKWAYTSSGTAFEVISNIAYAWNVAAGGNTNQPGFAKWIGAGTFNANQYATVTYAYFSGVEIGPGVRISGNSGYIASCQAAGCKLVKIVSGVATEVTTFGGAIATGSVVELDVTGTSSAVLTLTVGGVTYQTYTDSSSPLTTGVAGICSYYSSSNSLATSFSNVTGGNL